MRGAGGAAGGEREGGRAEDMLTFYILLLLLSMERGPAGRGGEVALQRQKRLKPQIIGGSDSRPGDWPWQVSVQKGQTHVCGGSILDSWWVLTAAHCLLKLRASSLSVEMGTINLRHNDGERHRVSDVWPHPNFNKTTFEDDVALLLVKPRIRFGDNLEPVWLAADTLADIRSWAPCYVIGWGVTRNEKRPSMLQEVEVKLIDWERCQRWMPAITGKMLCAGFEEGGRDACQGDSGGPLMCQGPDSEQWVQLGIVSWGNGCGQSKSPGVYTLLPMYVEWIKTTTAGAGKPYAPRRGNATGGLSAAEEHELTAIFGRQMNESAAELSTRSGGGRVRALLATAALAWSMLVDTVNK